MESKPIGHLAEGLRPILTVASQADFAEALRQQRLAKGLTLADLDHIAGFHDGYASHLERPFARTGKKSFKLTPMAGVWLEVLGLRLALVPVARMSSALGEGQQRATSEEPVATRQSSPLPNGLPHD